MMDECPLHGRRIAVTRPPHKAVKFAQQLRALGAEPVLVPLIRIEPPEDASALDAALRQLDSYDWAIFTSANTVTHVWARLDALGVPPARWPRIAAIGPATARALESHGITANVIPVEHVAEALFAAVARTGSLRGQRVLLPQADRARPILASLLRDADAAVDAVIAYRTVLAAADDLPALESLDAITFTSSSTVESFCTLLDEPAALPAHILVACIGPVTAQTADALGLPVGVVAEPHTIDGLLAALCSAFERNPTR